LVVPNFHEAQTRVLTQPAVEREIADPQYRALFAAVGRIQHDAWLRDLVGECIEKVLSAPTPSTTITDAHVEQIAALVGQRYREEMTAIAAAQVLDPTNACPANEG